ncbi:DNA mismatch repair protein MutS [Pedobacter psychrophilus]|uniref:DNA mismatch repair protein MutS n=1 Tax=Pedobacter psychrophilus TaxID=1826909 RepID=A0A179DFR9_9SPHI|nr:DNA mismatch repair protein MutS [Pedobacter psychrophilus]OAQ39896.1 DNA mismatch repair protein MutS [Pedobacter psychrophilus]
MIDYLQQKTKLESEIKALKKLINQYSFARLILFGIDILLIYLFFNQGITILILVVVLSLIGFMFLVKKQVKHQSELKFLSIKKLLVENEINIKSNKINIYNNGEGFCNPQHPYTDDLDIFGAHSLFEYINRSATNESQNILANFLKSTSTKTQIEERQIAIEELADKYEESLNFRTRLFDIDKSEIITIKTFFSDFLPNKLEFLNSKFINILILITPVLSVGVLILSIIFNGLIWNIFGLILLLSGVCYMFYKQKIDQIHEQIGKSVNGLEHYAENIKWIENEEWKSNLLNQLKSSIKKTELISQEIFSLSKILNSLNSRLNPIVGLFLNLFFQWDLRTLKRLSKWEAKNKSEIINAFEVLVNFEALISLATFSSNHSNWVYPKILNQYHFQSEAIGHPLINENSRIDNDFQLAKNITVDVITGSNMAGKSTFLRTVGINMVLSYAGAKVCAKNMETSIFSLISYMRIKDSLANQTSTFKAEIDRLKMILDFTQSHQNSFVLIDEMLRGTNSKDKYLGSKVFIKKLIAQNTPGFIATHDLQIAELEKEFPTQLRNFHFDITIGNQEMFFDYKIKNGECKTFNASILLKAIGIEIED